MVTIEVGPVWSYISGPSYPYKEIEKECTYFKEGSQFSRNFGKGRWDGKIRLFRNGRLPTGLVEIAKRILSETNTPYEITLRHTPPRLRQYTWELSSRITPYPEQVAAMETALTAKRGVLKLPTGSGKTAIIASGLIAKFGVRALFVANQNILLYQAKEEFEKNIVGCGEIGIIAEGESNIQPVTVASVQSLWSKKDDNEIARYLANEVDLIIVDETHVIGTKTWKGIMGMCNAPYRFGLSATPTRVDGADLEIFAQTGPIIYESNASDMINEDRLSEVLIEFVPFDHGLFNINMRYPELYEHQIVNNVERNNLIINETIKLLNDKRDILILVQRIKHGDTLKQLLADNKITDVEFVFGEITGATRQNLIKDYKQGKFRVLIGSTIFDVGADLPRVSGLVLAGAGQSKVRALQRVGRAIRKWETKEFAWVIDIGDYNIKYFEKQAKNRRDQYLSEFGEERVKTRESYMSKESLKLKEAHWTVRQLFDLF